MIAESSATHPAGAEVIRQLLDAWADGLSSVLASMTDSQPEIRRDLSPGDEGAAEGELWWEQPFPFAPGAAAWVGAPPSAWEPAGTATLKAAGLDTVDQAEARNTWLEIVSQSFSAMARGLSAQLGVNITCEGGQERAPAGDVPSRASFFVTISGTELAPLTLALSAALIEAVSSVRAAPDDPPGDSPQASERPATQDPAPRSRTMDLLLDIELPVCISFGRINLPMKDVLKLTTGSIVELDRDVNEPVDVLVNRCLIARGEVVVVEGNYGVRIQQIVSRQERLRSIP